MSVTVRHVPAPTEAELDTYTKVLEAAFDHKFFAFGLGGDPELQDPIHRAHLAAALASNEGEIHIAEWPGEGVVGVAVWFGPGSKFLATEAQREAGWNQLMAKLSPELRDWWTQFLSEYDEMVNSSVGADVKLGGYHLQLIGVLPSFQRKRVGTALLAFTEDKARVIKVPTCLETAGDNLKQIYQAIGYEVAGEGPIHLPGTDATFKMFAFIKHTELA